MTRSEKKQYLKRYLIMQKDSDQAYQDLIEYRNNHDDLLELMASDPECEIVLKYMELRSRSIQKGIAALRAHRELFHLTMSITNGMTDNDQESLVLALRYIHGMKVNQIADFMCCCKENIYRIINRGLDLIEI